MIILNGAYDRRNIIKLIITVLATITSLDTKLSINFSLVSMNDDAFINILLLLSSLGMLFFESWFDNEIEYELSLFLIELFWERNTCLWWNSLLDLRCLKRKKSFKRITMLGITNPLVVQNITMLLFSPKKSM